MNENAIEHGELLELTSDIVAAHVSNNPVPLGELCKLWRFVRSGIELAPRECIGFVRERLERLENHASQEVRPEDDEHERAPGPERDERERGLFGTAARDDRGGDSHHQHRR